MSSQSSAAGVRKPPKVKQACDCCHARKIRCDGTNPCNNCQLTSLPCTYLSIPKKKGPKGPSKRTPRAILKMQMRQDNPIKIFDHHYANVRPSTATSSPTVSPQTQEANKPNEALSSVFVPSPSITHEVVEPYVDTFFTHKYAITPIIHREQLYSALPSFRTSPEIYALVCSICAAIITQGHPDSVSVSSPDASSNDGSPTAEIFMNEAKRARQNRDYVEKPLLSDAQTSFFLFAALFNFDRHNSAWFYLRESMTILQMLRLHEEDSYLKMDTSEALFSRRTFWLLFVTERAIALQRHRPLTLQRTIDLPDTNADDPDAPIISGFLDLVSLFQNFDDNFVTLWNTSTRTTALPFSGSDSTAIAQLAALQSILSGAIPDVAKRPATQQADLLISRQWLKTMTWQLCVTKGLLSSSSQDESMSFHYPVTIARDVVSASRFLGREAFDPHGPGILEKIFDIGCSLADVLQLHPTTPGLLVASMEVGPRDYLMEMIKLCSTVLGGSSRYVSLLATKADECFNVGPRMIEGGTERIVELQNDELGQDGTADTGLEQILNTDVYSMSPTEVFDLGALSDVSMAWIGSMSSESYSAVDVDDAAYEDMYKYESDSAVSSNFTI